ncbi:MAG: DUF1028 domain-containing protein [Halobacteriales archaeon]|nr:DUF1028 domain-containing protein [Halobacteriales archaeon]
MKLSTFSIVACDLDARQWGVAVQSKFMAVGPIVPWAEPNVGAVATQALANPDYGPQGLELMRSGQSAEEALAQLTRDDDQRDHRQAGLVDAQGRVAAYTGSECYDWAGHHVGDGYACQGNILAGEAVVGDMAETFESASGTLAQRLLNALQAAQRAGGDKRGQQSAALLVVQEKAGYGGISDKLVDLRVDDHTRPIDELERLFELHQLYFGQTHETIDLDNETIGSIQQMLSTLGYYDGAADGELTDETLQALENFHNMENLEMRKLDDPARLDAEVLRFMERKQRDIV